MRVEKIEFNGFKSFSDKTVFTLHPGINCIVGPNGCGKSNVVDAFKWVLGEQSAKSLRGSKMEEVIFSGSQSKKPKGMAEVSLFIEGMNSGGNGDSTRPTVVTRRLYRSGDSDYLMNRETCRLKDIRDLFLDTGLEVKSYSILEQDRISAILRAKPEERRFLIEEVAGVVKYKVRRAEAQSKLESSRNNLVRINDIIGEVKRQINSLERQVKKAERYKRLMAELRGMELRLAKRDYDNLVRALGEIDEKYKALSEQDASQRAELGRAETDLESRRIALVEREKAVGALQEELSGREREVAEQERLAAVAESQRQNLEEYTGKLENQLKEAREKHAGALERREAARAERGKLSAEIEELEKNLKSHDEALAERQRAMGSRQSDLEDQRRQLKRTSEEANSVRNDINIQRTLLESQNKREESLKTEIASAEEEIKRIEASVKEVSQSIIARQNEHRTMTEERTGLEQEIAALSQSRKQKHESLTSARERLAADSTRIESLKEFFAAGGITEDLSPLALVSGVIEVLGTYERAIEGALREAINGLVFSEPGEVLEAVAKLKDDEAEITALLAINDPDGERGGNQPALPEGAVGWALDLVKPREGYEGVARRLLAGVAVVRTLKEAMALRGGGGLTLVTLGGEVLEPSGVVLAGKSRGVLERRRQIRELEAEIEEFRKKTASIEEDIKTLDATISEKQAALDGLKGRIAESERELQGLRHRSEKHGEELERAERRLSYLRIESENVQKEREGIKEKLETRERSLAQVEDRAREMEGAIARLEEELQSERGAFEEQRSRAVEFKLSLNSYRERLEGMDRDLRALDNQLRELGERDTSLQNELRQTGERITTLKEEAARKRESLGALVVQTEELKRRIGTEREALSEGNREVAAAEEQIRALRSKVEPVMRQMGDLEVSRTEHRVRIENLLERIKLNYEEDLSTLEVEPPTEEDEEQVEGVRTKIQALGPVSLASIEEHEELKERYEFLTGQKSDVETSIAELEEAITRINSTTRKKLRDAFDLLNEKFGEVFVLLFGGGRAELRMTDESNILETGIDIAAQPPGKRLQNINLMSGGEKTLTALALLFSSFLIKPTPICILDEADSALDESNTAKFSEMLRQFAKDTQFLVITHNRVTMEAADYIYGITMEEPGCSKVISVELVS